MMLTIPKSERLALREMDPILGQVMDFLPPIERPGTADLFESIIGSIISQQISTKAAITIRQRLLDKVGSITPENVAALSREEIQALGMSFRKAGYMETIAQEVLSGRLNLEELSSFSDERVIEELVALPGVGRWTAEMLLIFSLGRSNVLSMDDLGIRRGIERVYAEPPNKETLRVLKEKFSPYGTAAGLVFWQVAGLGEEDLAQLYHSLGR